MRRALDGGRALDASSGGRLVVAVPLLSGERVTGVIPAVRGEAAVTHRPIARGSRWRRWPRR